MKIGYYGYGHLVPNQVAADGGYYNRTALIKELRRQGHELLWLGYFRDTPTPEDRKRKDYTLNMVRIDPKWTEGIEEARHAYGADTRDLDSGKIITWYNKRVRGRLRYPDVDFAIIEVNCMALNKYHMSSILSYYTKRGIKCFLWDKDLWGVAFNGPAFQQKFGIDGRFVYNLTPYSKFKPAMEGRRVMMYYGYDRDYERWDIRKDPEATPFVYVGNDYRRGAKLAYFYKDLDCRIVGKFINDKENIVPVIGAQKFLGPVAPDQVVPTIAPHLACIQVVPPNYERAGLMTQRVNETTYGRCICFFDDSIIDASKFTLPDQVVATGAAAQHRLESFLKHSEFDHRVKAQRALLPTYKQQLPALFEAVAQKVGKP